MGHNSAHSDRSAAAENQEPWLGSFPPFVVASHTISPEIFEDTFAESSKARAGNSPEDSTMDDVTIVDAYEPEKDSLGKAWNVPSYDDIVHHITRAQISLTRFHESMEPLTLAFEEADLQMKYSVPCAVYFQWIHTYQQALITPYDCTETMEQNPSHNCMASTSVLNSEHAESRGHPVQNFRDVCSVDRLFQNAINNQADLCDTLNMLHRLTSSIDIEEMKAKLDLKSKMYYEGLERLYHTQALPCRETNTGNTNYSCSIGCTELQRVHRLVVSMLRKSRNSGLSHKLYEKTIMHLQQEIQRSARRLERLECTKKLASSCKRPLFQERHLQATSFCHATIQKFKVDLMKILFGPGYDDLDVHDIDSIYMRQILGERFCHS